MWIIQVFIIHISHTSSHQWPETALDQKIKTSNIAIRSFFLKLLFNGLFNEIVIKTGPEVKKHKYSCVTNHGNNLYISLVNEFMLMLINGAAH